MGVPWEIIAHGIPDEHRAVDAAYREIERIESLLSRFRLDSEIGRINRQTQRWIGPGRIKINREVGRVLSQGLRLAALTEGAFDPTAGALSRLWGFGPDGPRSVPPDEEQIQTALKRVGYRKVCIDEDRGIVTITQPGLEFDLGGMGKGYAIDRSVAILKAHGIYQGWVSCGSTAFALGTPMGRDAWRIGIQNPRRPDHVIQTVRIRDRAISTSGAYEQFFTYDVKRYGHICDPHTGYPAEGPAGVTVIAPTAIEADAFSTAAFVLGTKAGRSVLGSQEGVKACFMEEGWDNISIQTTPGWIEASQSGFGRRRFLAGMLAALGLWVLKPLPAGGTAYMTEEEALREILPEGREFRKETVALTAEQKEQVNTLVGRKIEEDTYTFYHAHGTDPEVTIGYGAVLDVIGKERPITFLIGISPQARIVGLEVLVYRESQGSEIRSKRFMKQFIGKTVEAPLKLGRDIDGISGASLSSRSTAYAVKKALALTQVVYGIHAESSP